MPDRLEGLLRGCTVRVTGGPVSGAGFFVAPAMVLTCVHLIGDGTGLEVRWERDGQPVLKARVCGLVAVLADKDRPIPALDCDYPDIAVLTIDGLAGHPCVRIDPEWPSSEDKFQVFGYPEEGGAVQLTPAQLTYRGPHGTFPTAYLDLASDTIKPGMSGAAVLNRRTGAVCGVVVASKHPAHPEGALAISWSSIAPQLGEVQAANQAFHRQDRRWEEAAAPLRKRLQFQLPRVVAHFTGRADLLDQLHAALNAGRRGVIIEIISGLGGVGKTQLAAAYVQNHYEEFDIAAWVRADDSGIADLADLAGALGRPVKRRTPPERARDVLVFLSNTDRRWLLVFDDAPGPQELAQLPNSGPGRILVTSRRHGGWGDFGPELVVDEFDPDIARRYLLDRSGRTDHEADDADAVATAVGYLPLALDQAGAYCAADAGVSFGEYLERLRDLPAQELFNTNRAAFYRSTVAATWNTSITAAEQQAPLARQALQMTAYLAPETILRSFFSVLDDSSAAGRTRVDDALLALHSYSLATRTGEQISVHRLLQKVIRDQLSGKEQESAASHALTAIQALLPSDPKLPEAWPQWQELVPHAAALASIDAVANLNAAQLVRILNPMCRFLLSAGFIQSPEGSPVKSSVVLARPLSDLVTKAVDVATDHLGPEHPDTLAARAILARWTGEAGDAAGARDQFAALLGVEEQVLEPEHHRTLADRDSLARWTGEAGDAAGARDQFAALLPVREGVRGPEHASTLTTRANLAYWTGMAGDAARARDQVAALLPVRERVLGPEHPDTLADRGGLARWTGDAGDAAGARDQVAELLKVEERVLGPEHPDTLANRGGLAHWTGEAGDAAGARDQVAELLPVRERVLGAKHPDTLTTRDSLAHWTGDAGDAAGARNQLAALLPVRRRVLSPEHPDTLATRGALAHWTGAAGDAAGARDQFAALLGVEERVLGPEHASTLATRGALAHWTGEAGNPAGARDQFAALLGVQQRVLGPEHPSSLATRGGLARWTGDAGDAAGARDEFAALLPVRERVLGPEHPDTLATRGGFARWTGDAGDAAEARDQFAALLQLEERVLGPEHASTVATRGALAYWTRRAGGTPGKRRLT